MGSRDTGTISKPEDERDLGIGVVVNAQTMEAQFDYKKKES